MDRQQALSRLVPVGSASLESVTARADGGWRVALGNNPVSCPTDKQECSELAIGAAAEVNALLQAAGRTESANLKLTAWSCLTTVPCDASLAFGAIVLNR